VFCEDSQGGHHLWVSIVFLILCLSRCYQEMKVALHEFELTPYLMAKPLDYRVSDGCSFGWVEIPEFSFSGASSDNKILGF